MTKEQFKKFAKEEFGYDISFEESDNPDTYESLFGSCKGCEHAPTTYEEYCCNKISNIMNKYPKTYSDKVYDAVTIYEGIEEVEQVGIRKGLEMAINIIKVESEE